MNAACSMIAENAFRASLIAVLYLSDTTVTLVFFLNIFNSVKTSMTYTGVVDINYFQLPGLKRHFYILSSKEV